MGNLKISRFSAGSIYLDPAEIRIFKCILRFWGPRKKKGKPGAEGASPAPCAIGFCASLDAQKKRI